MLPRLRDELDGLLARHAAFEAETRALSDAQLRFRPVHGAWSISEVAEHLLRVEREVTKAACKPGIERRGRRRTPREWIGFGVFLAIVHLDVRIKVPQAVAGRVTPATNPDMAQLWSKWTEVHVALARYLETVNDRALREMAFKHPIMGPTKVTGMLPFLHKHFAHHMRQVSRIRAAPGFPPA